MYREIFKLEDGKNAFNITQGKKQESFCTGFEYV